MLPAQPNQSLIDGLTVLQALAVSTEPVGGRALARELNLEPTRVNRLLKTLAYLGMARQTPSRKYLPGPAMHVLSAQSLFGSGLTRRAMPVLEELRKTGKLVALGVLWRDQVCYIYHALPKDAATSGLGRMGLYPASQSSIGRVLLAQQEEDHIRALYQDRPIPLVPGGIEELLTILRQVKTDGYALAIQSTDPYNASLAIPVGTPPYAGLAVASDITQDQIPQYLPLLRTAADRIESKTK